jgi:hypothetical protein
MIKYLVRGASLIGLLAVVAASLLLLGRDGTSTGSAATFFNPCAVGTLSSTAANTPVDVHGTFGIGLKDDCSPYSSAKDNPPNWNSAGLIYFTPPGFTVAHDADIPDGTEVGQFKSKAVLGLFDNGCNQVISVDFKLLDATIDQTKVVHPNAPGTPDRLKPLAVKDANGVPIAASGWPDFLSGLPDKVGMNFDKLIARFVGINTTSVVGTTVILNFLVFDPGATVSRKIKLDPQLGYPSVTVLQDPTAVASSGDPVSDFCAPLWTDSTLKGTAAGKTFRGTGPNGVYNSVVYVVPAPDADNDGIENSLDPCPYDPNLVNWDPRGVLEKNHTPGDQDVDGLPEPCDPDPANRGPCSADNGASGHDQDCDGWANGQDNCPLVKNGAPEHNPGVGNQDDADSDGIGDACDQNINTLPGDTVDGQNLPVCLVTKVTIGSGGPDPVNAQTLAPCDPNAVPVAATATPGPTPTFIPGTTTRPTSTPAPTSAGGGGGGVGGGPSSGIGSLSPTGSDIPVWAAILAAIGALGLAFGLSVTGARFWRRR